MVDLPALTSRPDFLTAPIFLDSRRFRPNSLTTVGVWQAKTALAQCRLWVKTGKAQCEQMFSALPPKADIARRSRHVGFVPRGDLGQIIRSARRRARAASAALRCRAPWRSPDC